MQISLTIDSAAPESLFILDGEIGHVCWFSGFKLTSIPHKLPQFILVSADQVLDQRVQSLERELDAAISAASRARTEKRQAEAAQRAAELRAQEVTKELENTASMYCPVSTVHFRELNAVFDHDYILQECLSYTWRSCG